MIWHPPPLFPLRRTKVRGHRAGSRLSSWHLEVRAARKSGAWGSVSSTCRNTTFSSCWRTALSSCALPGPRGLWLSSGSTLRGWKRFVSTIISLISLNLKKVGRFLFEYQAEIVCLRTGWFKYSNAFSKSLRLSKLGGGLCRSSHVQYCLFSYYKN